MNLKNVRAHSLDVGGRMLPSGQAADLNAAFLPVAEAIEAGHLVAVQSSRLSEPSKES